jgi:hypothetical protein
MLQCFIWYIKEQGGTFSFIDQEHTPLPESLYDWSRVNDPLPEEASKTHAAIMEAEAKVIEEELEKEKEIEANITAMSPIEKEARIQQLNDQGDAWSKEKSLLEFTTIYPDAKPTFQSQKIINKHRTHISNMAVFLKKRISDLRAYEHRAGTLDALLDADEFLFTRLSLIGALFKVMNIKELERDIDGSVLADQANEITEMMKKAVGLFDGIKLFGIGG